MFKYQFLVCNMCVWDNVVSFINLIVIYHSLKLNTNEQNTEKQLYKRSIDGLILNLWAKIKIKVYEIFALMFRIAVWK